MIDLLLALAFVCPLFALFLAHIGFSEDAPLFRWASVAMVVLGALSLVAFEVLLP